MFSKNRIVKLAVLTIGLYPAVLSAFDISWSTGSKIGGWAGDSYESDGFYPTFNRIRDIENTSTAGFVSNMDAFYEETDGGVAFGLNSFSLVIPEEGSGKSSAGGQFEFTLHEPTDFLFISTFSGTSTFGVEGDSLDIEQKVTSDFLRETDLLTLDSDGPFSLHFDEVSPTYAYGFVSGTLAAKSYDLFVRYELDGDGASSASGSFRLMLGDAVVSSVPETSTTAALGMSGLLLSVMTWRRRRRRSNLAAR